MSRRRTDEIAAAILDGLTTWTRPGHGLDPAGVADLLAEALKVLLSISAELRSIKETIASLRQQQAQHSPPAKRTRRK